MLKTVIRLAKELWADERGDIGSIIGGIGGILGAGAAGDAADAQAAAAQKSIEAQLAMYGQTRNDQMPWLSVGGGAINRLGYLMGINPMTPPTADMFSKYTPAGGNWAGNMGNVNATAAASTGAGGTAGSFGGMQVIRDNNGVKTYQTPYGRVIVAADGKPPKGGARAVAYFLSNQNAAGAGSAAGAGGAAGGASGGTAGDAYPGGGFGSLAKPFGMSDFEQDPGYAFRLAEGEKALQRSQAAKGGLLGGAAAKAMLDYGQGMGSQEYMNAFNRFNTNQTNLYNRLAGLSGTGQTSANTLANVGQNAAGSIGNSYGDVGNARSAGSIAQGNMWQSGLGAIGSGLSNYFGNNSYGNPSNNILWDDGTWS